MLRMSSWANFFWWAFLSTISVHASDSTSVSSSTSFASLLYLTRKFLLCAQILVGLSLLSSVLLSISPHYIDAELGTISPAFHK